MEVTDRPYDAAAGRGRDEHRRRSSPHLAGHGRPQAAAPGRGDPLPPPRRLLGQRHGRLAGAGGSDPRGRRHGWRRSAGSPTATSGPTYADWPYSVFTMAHGRSKEECDAILDGIADDARPARRRSRRPLLLDRVQEDPPPLLHRRLRPLGGGALISRSEELYRRALEVMPGGVNSPVRAMRSIGREPDLHRARRGPLHLGRRRQPLRRLGLLLGAADPRATPIPLVVEAVRQAAGRGTSYGAPTAGEVELADGGRPSASRASRWSG